MTEIEKIKPSSSIYSTILKQNGTVEIIGENTYTEEGARLIEEPTPRKVSGLAEPTSKKRGRPKGSKNKKAEAVETPKQDIVVVDQQHNEHELQVNNVLLNKYLLVLFFDSHKDINFELQGGETYTVAVDLNVYTVFYPNSSFTMPNGQFVVVFFLTETE